MLIRALRMDTLPSSMLHPTLSRPLPRMRKQPVELPRIPVRNAEAEPCSLLGPSEYIGPFTLGGTWPHFVGQHRCLDMFNLMPMYEYGAAPVPECSI